MMGLLICAFHGVCQGGWGRRASGGKGMEHVPAEEAPVCIDGTEHFLLACRSPNAALDDSLASRHPHTVTGAGSRSHCLPLMSMSLMEMEESEGPHQYSNSLYSLCHSPGWLSLPQISSCVLLLDIFFFKQIYSYRIQILSMLFLVSSNPVFTPTSLDWI